MKKIGLLLIALFTLGGLRAQLFEQPVQEEVEEKPAPVAKPKYNYYIPANGIWYTVRQYGCKIGYYEDKVKKEFLVYAYRVNQYNNQVTEYEMIQIPLDKSKPVAPNFKVVKNYSDGEAYLKWTGSDSHINYKILTDRGEVMEDNNRTYVVFTFKYDDYQKAQELADKLNAAVSNVK